MDFKFEEILKNIFPGSLIMLGIHFFITGEIPFLNWSNPFPESWKDFSSILLTMILGAAYLLGYFNDILASWLEDYVLYKISYKPTYLLLKGQTQRIILNNPSETFIQLAGKCAEHVQTTEISKMTEDDAARIFEAAKSIAEANASDLAKQKLENLYKAFNFSRNLLTTVIILTILVLIKTWPLYGFLKFLLIFGFLIGLIAILFLRWKERGLYHSRLILNTAKNAK